jgi:DNA-directed RNA polymerase subunit RPC12/RpoP
MAGPLDTGCTECGAVFPRSEARRGTDGGLACPACGASVVRGVPKQYTALTTRANTRCAACGSTFPRGEAETDVKGVLACPVCGSTSDLEAVDVSEDDGEDDARDP